MSVDRLRPWWPVAAFLVLAGLWWWTGRRPEVAQERSFKEVVLTIDTNQLQSFDVRPALGRHHPTLHFQRVASGWMVHAGENSTPADGLPMRRLLAAMTELRTERVLGPMERVGAAYGLTDSLAQVLVLDRNGVSTRLRIGIDSRSTGQEQTASAVLLEGDDQAYSVFGDLSNLTAMGFVDWIPKPMVNSDPADWQSLDFMFPGGTGYRMVRHGRTWTIDGLALDSSKVAKYLNNLSVYSGSALVDPRDTLEAVLAYQLLIEVRDRPRPIALGIFALGDRLIARSTLAPNWVVMPFDAQVELPRMFRPPHAFLAQPESH